jgi:Protein of unknown function (DUF1622)
VTVVTSDCRSYSPLEWKFSDLLCELQRDSALSLEFLIAADIMRTVLLDEAIKNIGILGALVVIRPLISWSVVVEVEGRWHGVPAAHSGGQRAKPDDSGKHVPAYAGRFKSTQWPTEAPLSPASCEGEMSCSPHLRAGLKDCTGVRATIRSWRNRQ